VATPVPARTLSAQQRQRMVCALAARWGSMKKVRDTAKALGLTAPVGTDVGSAWVAVMQELHLRNLDAGPLRVLCGEEV